MLASISAAFAEGAIAVGKEMPRQWFGVVVNQNTLQQARVGALAACARSGPNCSILATFRNACVAITWGETRGRAGYAATTRRSVDEARNAAMSNCHSQGMARCEIKYAACDTVDEAAEAERRRSEAEYAALQARERERLSGLAEEEARRRTRDAENAAQQARERARLSGLAEEEARRRSRDSAPSGGMSTSGISNKKALGFGIALIVGIFIVILKQGYPQLAGWTADIMPAVSFFAYAFFGIEVKDEVTLAEWPLFAPIFGGVIVAAIAWKIHA